MVILFWYAILVWRIPLGTSVTTLQLLRDVGERGGPPILLVREAQDEVQTDLWAGQFVALGGSETRYAR